MEKLQKKKENCSCAPPKKPVGRKNLPLAFTILIAVLPKCPFCILAYSSAITMCSGQKWYDHSPSTMSYISIVLCLIVLLSIIFNYRDLRTVFAIILALAGTALVMTAELYTGEMMTYNYGTILLLIAALLNGSLIHFVRRLFLNKRTWLNKIKSTSVNS